MQSWAELNALVLVAGKCFVEQKRFKQIPESYYPDIRGKGYLCLALQEELLHTVSTSWVGVERSRPVRNIGHLSKAGLCPL